jgi:hypothetical protein
MANEKDLGGQKFAQRGQREWCPPQLRKLPISATATAKIHFGDEGNCGGKGDAGFCLS